MAIPQREAPAPADTGSGRKDKTPRQHGSNATTEPAAALLDRLERVRKTGPGRWLARCPSHDDRTPSLAVREADDGTVLVKCSAGCGAADVVGAVGLELRDLFPDRLDHRRRPTRPGERHVPRDALRAVADEAVLVLIAAEDTAAGKALADTDRNRLALATKRLRAAAREAGCNG